MSSPIEVSIRSFWPFCGRPMRSGARKMKPMRICRQMWSRSWRARPSGWKSTLALMMHPSMAHSSKMVSTLEKWDDWHWSTEFLIECNILVIHWCEWIRVEQLLWQFHFVPEALYRLAEVDSRVSHFEQLEFHSEDSWRGGKNRHSTTGIYFDSHHKQSHANATIHYSCTEYMHSTRVSSWLCIYCEVVEKCWNFVMLARRRCHVCRGKGGQEHWH